MKKEVFFNFKLSNWWNKGTNHGSYLKSLHQESHEAMKSTIEMLEGEWDSKVTRFPICIETNPFAQIPVRKYTMASEEEFLHLKHQNADLIVRHLTAEEMLHLTQQEEN